MESTAEVIAVANCHGLFLAATHVPGFKSIGFCDLHVLQGRTARKIAHDGKYWSYLEALPQT